MKIDNEHINRKKAQAVVELSRIKTSGLELFVSQAHQDPIFMSTIREILVRGGNRSGKSTVCAVLFAALATNREVTLSDGRKINPRQPHQRNRPLRMWVIGYSSTYIGQTIYRLLFQPNLFDTIRDENTGRFRALDKTNPSDMERYLSKRPSPPLIPKAYVKPGSWNWENRGNKEFNRVTICNPQDHDEVYAEIFAYSSQSEPKAGDPVDIIWVDESIEYPQHYPEWQARLADLRGRLFWSSWPRANNSALRKLTERAKEDASKPNPLAAEFILTTSGNNQLDPQGKAEYLGGFSKEELIARDQGEYNIELFKMYDLFNPGYHCAYGEMEDDKIAGILRATNGEPPWDWTREFVLDPGTAHPAVLFCAIPPPTLGEFYVVYDELYPGRCDAVQLAPMIKTKLQSYSLYRQIIDTRAGKQTPMSFSMSIADNYLAEFRKFGIKSEYSGDSFTWGLPEIGPRIMKLKSWMHPNPRSGVSPFLRIVTHRCPNLVKQLTNYMRDDSNDKEFRPAGGQQIDVAACLEYWAASNPRWVAPKPNNVGFVGIAAQHFFSMLSRQKAKGQPQGQGGYSLGSAYSPYEVK